MRLNLVDGRSVEKCKASGKGIFLASTMCAMLASLQKKENLLDYFLNPIPVEIPHNNDGMGTILYRGHAFARLDMEKKKKHSIFDSIQ